MEGHTEAHILQFIKNNIIQDISNTNEVNKVIEEFYKTKEAYQNFFDKKGKKLKLTIPDFNNILGGTPETKIITNLPIMFGEEKNKLQLFIRDYENKKNIREITIEFKSNFIDSIKIDNLEKQLLLYKINSIKKNKNKLEHITFEEEREEKLQKLTKEWTILKTEIETFSQNYSAELIKKSENERKRFARAFEIINFTDQTNIDAFHNNYLIKLLSTTLTDEETKLYFVYYFVINLLINKTQQIEALFHNSGLEQKIIGSIVYKEDSEIDIDNIFIVKSETSSNYEVYDLHGTIHTLPKETVSNIYNKLGFNSSYFQNILDKVDISSMNVTDKRISTTPLISKKNIQYEKRKRPAQQSYKDLSDSISETDSFISQEELETPDYKILENMKELNSFFTVDTDKKIFISHNISHSDIGSAYINAKSAGNLVKESCEGCSPALNMFKNWRIKLTREFINKDKTNGEILPIILDGKKFASVNHYMKFYKNVDNLEEANKYLLGGINGKIKLPVFDGTGHNLNINKKNNVFKLPNYIYELLRITGAKFGQNHELGKILKEMDSRITIINSVHDDPSTGHYEVSKELIVIRKQLQEGTINSLYPSLEKDISIAQELYKKIKNIRVSEFINVRTDKIIKRTEKTHIEGMEPDLYSKRDVEIFSTDGFAKNISKMLEITKLKKYVEENLHGDIYNVPGDGNCMFYAVVVSFYEKGGFTNLKGNLKKIFNTQTLQSKVQNIITGDGVMEHKPFLSKAALVLRNIVGDILEENYNEYKTFIKSLRLDESGDISEQISQKIKTTKSNKKGLYKFIDDLVLDIEGDRYYTDIQDYINTIKIDSKEISEFYKGWGGSAELRIISVLFGVDIQTYPSNSIEIQDLDNYYKYKFKELKKIITIPPKYLRGGSNKLGVINLGFLIKSPQHYVAIVDDKSSIENVLLKNLAVVRQIGHPESVLNALLDMGFGLEMSETALINTYGNKEQAIEYILSHLQRFKSKLESDDDQDYRFQIGELDVLIGGRMTNIHDFFNNDEEGLFGDYEFLEGTHDYIQWLFPTQTVSRFVSKKVLTTSELTKLRDSDVAKNNLISSLITMWDFYGGNLNFFEDEAHGDLNFSISHNDNHKERIENINTPAGLHNQSRITRILTYLDLMANHSDPNDFILKLQYEFLSYFIDVVCRNWSDIVWHSSYISSSSKSSIEYWIDTVRDIKKRKHLYELAHIYLKQSGQNSMLQTGGRIKNNNSNILEKLDEAYFSFPYRYNNLNYDIAYRILPGSKKNIEILGFLQNGGKIYYDKYIPTGSYKDTILVDIYNKLSKNKLNIKKTQIRKINYHRDIVTNKIMVGGNIIGDLNTNGDILF